MIPGAVHIYLTTEENPRKPQLGDCRRLYVQSSPHIGSLTSVVSHSTSGGKRKERGKGRSRVRVISPFSCLSCKHTNVYTKQSLREIHVRTSIFYCFLSSLCFRVISCFNYSFILFHFISAFIIHVSRKEKNRLVDRRSYLNNLVGKRPIVVLYSFWGV